MAGRGVSYGTVRRDSDVVQRLRTPAATGDEGVQLPPSESVRRPTVPEVLPRLWTYLSAPGNGAGGSLHIVTDDGNLANHHVEWCIEWAEENGDGEGAELARALLAMSWTGRRKVIARASYGGYWV